MLTNFLQKIRLELPYDPATPSKYLLKIKKEKKLVCKDGCTSVFVTPLFTIAKTWKQPKCPLRDDWIKKTWDASTMEHSSAVRKYKVLPFGTPWMDLESITLSEISQKRTIWLHSYVRYKKATDEQTKWNKLIDNRTAVTRGEEGGKGTKRAQGSDTCWWRETGRREVSTRGVQRCWVMKLYTWNLSNVH